VTPPAAPNVRRWASQDAMNARDPISPKPSPNARGQAAIVHVDLGADLKSAVCAAAQRAGMRPSEWIRSQLAKAVTAAEPGFQKQDESGLRRRHPSAASGPAAEPKTHQLSLQSDDLAWLDQIALAGGFRSRPAALRYALRVLANPDSLVALKQLPQAIPALVQSNMTLQTAVRLRNLLPLDGRAQSRLEAEDKAALRREITQHLQEVSRLVAALQPLLATAGSLREGRAR
jgi:hypothetical protein